MILKIDWLTLSLSFRAMQSSFSAICSLSLLVCTAWDEVVRGKTGAEQ